MRAQRVYPERKRKMLDTFVNLLKENRYLIIVDAYKCRTAILNEARFYEDEYGFRMKGGKNTILKLAMRKVRPQALNVAEKVLSGQNIFIFTNNDPFELVFKLGKLEVQVFASPGDIATDDIIVKEGNTGLPPGPIISLFSACKIPTKVVSGTIYIAKDTVVAKKGEVISMNLANLLNKLGIKPIKIRMVFKAAIDLEKGVLVPGEMLRPEFADQIRKQVEEAVEHAIKLAVGINYPTPETIGILVITASLQARKLAEEVGYVSPESLPQLITKAVAVAKRLSETLNLAKEAS